MSKGLGKHGFYAQIDLDQPKAYAYAIELMAAAALTARRPGGHRRLPREAQADLRRPLSLVIGPSRPRTVVAVRSIDRGSTMRLSMQLSYAGGFKETVQQVVDLEQAGLDIVWVAEAYSFDAISQMGYLAAKTERIQIGSGIVNVYSRTPALMAMTFAGLDYVSDGRIICGLGASGPQVDRGLPRRALREADAAHQGVHRGVPHGLAAREARLRRPDRAASRCPQGQGTGLGKPLKLINHPVRADIPIWWASLMGLSVEATAELADGWLPIMFIPERADRVWGDELAGRPGQALARPRPARDLRRRHRRHRRGPRR